MRLVGLDRSLTVVPASRHLRVTGGRKPPRLTLAGYPLAFGGPDQVETCSTAGEIV
jgi:hypothetical protein